MCAEAAREAVDQSCRDDDAADARRQCRWMAAALAVGGANRSAEFARGVCDVPLESPAANAAICHAVDERSPVATGGSMGEGTRMRALVLAAALALSGC